MLNVMTLHYNRTFYCSNWENIKYLYNVYEIYYLRANKKTHRKFVFKKDMFHTKLHFLVFKRIHQKVCDCEGYADGAREEAAEPPLPVHRLLRNQTLWSDPLILNFTMYRPFILKRRYWTFPFTDPYWTCPCSVTLKFWTFSCRTF